MKAMHRFTVLFVLMVAPHISPASDLDTYRKTYTDGLSGINTSYESEIAEIRSAYAKGLSTIRAQVQAAGDLDALKAVLAEQERFQKEQSLPSDSSGFSSSVRSLWQTCQQHIQRADTEKLKKTSTLVAQYSNALERLQRQLTQQGKVDEATAVQEERRLLQETSSTGSRNTGTHTRPAGSVEQDSVSAPSALVPVEPTKWRAVIWNNRAYRWQKQDLAKLTTRMSQDVFWVKNTSKVHRAAKVALLDSLVGDFSIVTEIKGRFGIELMNASGESSKGYGVYGFPKDEWIRLVVTRKGGTLSIQCSDGKQREFKGKQDDPRVPLDFCISLSQGNEVEIRHFTSGEGGELASARMQVDAPTTTSVSARDTEGLTSGKKDTPRRSETPSSTSSTKMADALRYKLEQAREEYKKYSDTGYGFNFSVNEGSLTRSRNQEMEGFAAYKRQMEQLLAEAREKKEEMDVVKEALRDSKEVSPRTPRQEAEEVLADLKPFSSKYAEGSAMRKRIDEAVAKIEGILKKEEEEPVSKKNVVSDIYNANKGKSGSFASLKQVVISPEKYEGKVVKLKMQAVSCFFGQFQPMLTPDFTSRVYVKVPKELEEKASRVDKAVGDYGVVTVTVFCKEMDYGNNKALGVMLDVE